MDRVAGTIIGRLPGTYSKDPAAVLAFRPAGEWSVEGWSLTAAGQAFDLRTQTVGALADALEAAGVAVTHRNPAVSHLSAAVVLEGSGDGVYVATSILASLIGAIGEPLEVARADVARALDQLILTQAAGDWLDVFGDVFGVARLDDEEDADYAARMRAEVGRTRCSAASILGNIERLTGRRLTLREPWREVFTIGRSRPSGTDRLQGAPSYQYHTIQLVSRETEDWARILPIAEADRPAGTLMLPPATRRWPIVLLGGLDVRVSSARVDVRFIPLEWPAPTVHLGHVGRRVFVTTGLRGPYRGGDAERWIGDWDSRKWARPRSRAEIHPPRSFIDGAPGGRYRVTSSGAARAVDGGALRAVGGTTFGFDHRIDSGGAVRITSDGGVRAIDES